MTRASIPHASISTGMAPSEVMASTMSSASVFCVMAAMAWTSQAVAVEVSECTTVTTEISGFSSSAFWISAGLTASPQGTFSLIWSTP